MLKKVLIANRGAIAVRIIRTLKQMGIASVSIYSEEDRDSLHVSYADESISLGAGPARDTYLDQDKIFVIANDLKVEAIHPGYGFLSENAEFVNRCEKENIIFLGPTSAQIDIFGLKHTARDLAAKSQVPLLSGTDLLNDISEARSAAKDIGYPVILKSTAGGGGIGMQICYADDDLQNSFESVKRLGENNFSNAGVFLEKYIEHARHIEVQIFGDGNGDVITLGERDCSTQRRNQKVIEEAPAPNLTDDVRQQLQQTAKQLASSVDYRSAGTVEFILDQATQAFYFLEVNTRLQVEHGVTEEVYGVDIVQWMLELGANQLNDLSARASKLKPTGHAIQVRLYAEDPQKDFQPSAGLLTEVIFPKAEKGLRIDHWLEPGIEVSPYFDPMLAKVIVHADSRGAAINDLTKAINTCSIYGIETNSAYIQTILASDIFAAGKIYTRYLNDYNYQAATFEVLAGGTFTSVQDYPGRTGYWDVGVPPSGPFDSLSFQMANQLINNDKNAAGLEITLNGPTLKFNIDTVIALTGADVNAYIDDQAIVNWQAYKVKVGQLLKLGKVSSAGTRAYLAIAGGIQCPDYLGSKSTFTLGQFGGHAGAVLKTGDVIHLKSLDNLPALQRIEKNHIPQFDHHWDLHVIYGPHGAPDFFTDNDIDTFFKAEWEVHYNSSRTGIRLIGPKPEWARSDGGEAGMHPSNIHDNAYAIGTIDFTGDMPVILGPDGPSLGGFVCPATVIQADLWKLGQLKAGDKVRFIPVAIDAAVKAHQDFKQNLQALQYQALPFTQYLPDTPIIKTSDDVVYRPSGDNFLLMEFGELRLDIALRFKVHAFMLWLKDNTLDGIKELTPGVRSLQIHYDSLIVSADQLIQHLDTGLQQLGDVADIEVPARIMHLPLSWDDEACRLAIEKYMQSVRHDAPWCPSNIEFIRRINGLDNIEEVKRILFEASYLVMGLGDVYLGAPLTTPLDPRHRLVTTKYNPARTWTAENSVGIGGSYMCIYGMEGPGGYQFVGRTLQMWNKYRQTTEFDKPWLLEFFDQIRFYEVSAEELVKIRDDFPKGRYPLKIEKTTFSLKDYQQFLEKNTASIAEFTDKREQAFQEELQRWIASGQINFTVEQTNEDKDEEQILAENEIAIESGVSGSVWQLLVKEGESVKIGQALMVIESMKMEISVTSHSSGIVKRILRQQGKPVNAGQALIILETD